MANSCYNHLSVRGAQEAVEAFMASATADALNAVFVQDSSVDAGELTSGDIRFSTNWKGSFDEAQTLSGYNPDVVVTLAAVELANGSAAARVWKNGDMLGEYEMPDGERIELAGEEGDEAAVIDSLFDTVSAYEEDALAAGGQQPG